MRKKTTSRASTRTRAETTTSGASSSPPAGRHGSAAAGGVTGELFAEHGRMVLGLCRLLLRDPVEAEDATQQVFLSAHRAVLGGSTPREPQPWLAAIARNECRARIHARMREPLALLELPSDLPDPLAAAIRAVDLDAVWAALSALPRRQRRAIVLREVGGLSYHELGRALGVSQSAVESLLFRARQQLRAYLANAGAVLFALRDDLARLIPGFDPGSVGLAGRIVSLPVAVKLATTAVGVGVVTTGATQFPHHAPRVTTHASVTRPAVVHIEPLERSSPALVAERSPRIRIVQPHAPTRPEVPDGTGRRGSVQDERERHVEEREEREVERRRAANVEEREPAEVHEDREGDEGDEGGGDPDPSGDDSEPDGPDN